MPFVAIASVWLVGCGFRDGKAQPDAAGPMITVAFQTANETQDHTSGTVQIPVVLSQAAVGPITVHYSVDMAVTDAIVGRDYMALPDGDLQFAPGDTVKNITVTFVPTSMDGLPNSTLAIALSMPVGATLGTNAEHKVTISGVTLPRVSFATASASASEGATAQVAIMMDKASTTGPTMVDLVLTGSAVQGTTGIYDYSYGPCTSGAPCTLTFPQGMTSMMIDLGSHADGEYNTNVDVLMMLQNAINMVIGAQATHDQTINEVDAKPTVQFTTSSGSQKESNGSPITVTVTLSKASRLTTTVNVTLDASTNAVAGTNYTISSTPTFAVTFNPGQTVQTFTIAPVDDNVADNGTQLVLDLASPTNATIGTTPRYTLTISDDDQTCSGDSGAFAVCVTKNANPVTLAGSFNTDTCTGGTTTPFSGWSGQPTACFVAGTQITVNGLTVTGSKALVLIASDTITINNTLDGSSHRGGSTGPGTAPGSCSTGGSNGANDSGGGGGGPGGSFRTQAGNGGNGGGGGSGGNAAAAVGSPSTLRTGCPGRVGGPGGNGNNAGAVGAAGGAIYLSAVNSITLASGSIIDVSGAGGSAAGTNNSSGGSGGGSGGMMRLNAPVITAQAGTAPILMANGGGGASGTDSQGGDNGNSGSDPSTSTPTTAASGGGSSGSGGSGGQAFPASGGNLNGANGGSSHSGGGGAGGGGSGEIQTSVTITGTIVHSP